MVLEDENGTEYGAVYIGKRTGLSGGWRGFALDHKLDDGDALVFELIEPARFKVYLNFNYVVYGGFHTCLLLLLLLVCCYIQSGITYIIIVIIPDHSLTCY